MKKILIIICAVIPLLITRVQSQQMQQDTAGFFAVDTITYFEDDPTITDLNFDANLDSLLNLYYVEQTFANHPDFWNAESDSLVPSFPDSVYIERLKSISTVVDLTYNSVVRRYIDVYSKERRGTVEIMLGLSQYYFPIFDDIFDYYDIPNEMKYMSIIESALNPRAVSSTRAVGLWQFMYGTGKLYDLTVNSLVDERRNPVKSTHAAARFVKDLYDIYHDWTLVIAAYNCGPGNVNRAIRRSGGKRNYWDIYYYLPRETRGHVPAFIAATYIMNFYKEHNLKPVPIELPIPCDTIMVTQNLHMEQVAEVLGIPMKMIHDLNPQYRTEIIPAENNPLPLMLPLEQTMRFIDYEKEIYAYKDSIYFNPEKVITTPTAVNSGGIEIPPADSYTKLVYNVKEGDNLGFISMWYNVRISDIRYWNNIRNNTIRIGQKLDIYKPNNQVSKYTDINDLTFAQKQARIGKSVSSASTQSSSQTNFLSSDYVIYTVKEGDTIWDIIKNYPGVTQTEVMKLNNLTDATKIRAGQQLKIRPKS